MGLVDEQNHVNFYDGRVRVVDPEGKELVKYAPADYAKHVAERVEPWTYLKFPYLRAVGWKGFVDGKDSGVYRATPGARLNVSDGMSTPLAQEAYEEYFETLTGDRTGARPSTTPSPSTGRGSWRCCTPRSGRRSSSATPRSPTPSTTGSCPPRPRTRGSGSSRRPAAL